MNKHITNFLSGIAEPAFDAVINNEIVREIPMVGSFVKLARAGMDFRDQWFLKKVHDFVFSVGEISDEKRLLIIAETHLDEKRRSKFGEAIFSVLEQSDSLVKIEYSACVFQAFLHKELSSEELKLITYAIRSTFTDTLVEFVESHSVDDTILKEVTNTGLASTKFKDVSFDRIQLGPQTNTLDPIFTITQAGETLRKSWKTYRKK